MKPWGTLETPENAVETGARFFERKVICGKGQPDGAGSPGPPAHPWCTLSRDIKPANVMLEEYPAEVEH